MSVQELDSIVISTHKAAMTHLQELGIGEGSILLPPCLFHKVMVQFSNLQKFPRGVLTHEGVPCDCSRFEARLTSYIKQSVRAKQWKAVQPRMKWLCAPFAAWILGAWSLEFFAVLGAAMVTVVTALYVLTRSPMWYSDATLLAATTDAERREIEDAFLHWYQQQPHLWDHEFRVIAEAEGPEGCKAPLIDLRVKQPEDPEVATALADAIAFAKKHNLNASLFGVTEALEWNENPALAVLKHIRKRRPERKPKVYAASVEPEEPKLETRPSSPAKWRKPSSNGFVSGSPLGGSSSQGGVATIERLQLDATLPIAGALTLPPVEPSEQVVGNAAAVTTEVEETPSTPIAGAEVEQEPEEDPWEKFRAAVAPLVDARREGRPISISVRGSAQVPETSSSSSSSSRKSDRTKREGYNQGPISEHVHTGEYCFDPFPAISFGRMLLIPCSWGPPEAFNALKVKHDAIVDRHR